MTLVNRRLDHVGPDKGVQWGAPSWEAHEAVLAMALYETHAQWRLNVVAGEWKRQVHAPNVGATPRAQTADEPQKTHTDQVHAEIAALEAHLSQLHGPSVPKLSLGEPQRVANGPLPYTWQNPLVEAFVIFSRVEALPIRVGPSWCTW